MSRIQHFAVIIAALTLLSGPAAGQDLDWNITGAGARAMGLGGAFIGVADDATSIVWNPAGLATLERPELSAVTRYITETVESDLNDPTTRRLPARTNELSHTVFNFASAAYPLTLGERKLVLAAAYQRQLDFSASRADRNSSFDSQGGVDTFTPGFGIRLSPVLALGGAANVWFGSASADFVRSNRPTSWDQTYSGFNLVFGALADLESLPNPAPVKVGASVKTPFDLTEEKSQNALTETNTYQMPLMVGFGGSCRIGDNLTLAADYEMRMFGDSKKIPQAGNEEPLSRSGEDLNQIRVGAEYLVVLGFGYVPIRAGFQTVPTVFANYDPHLNATGNFPASDQVSGIGLSVGSGYISSRFAVDATYSRRQFEQENSADGLVGTRTWTSDTFTVSGIVYF